MYSSPLGDILIAAGEGCITGVWFADQAPPPGCVPLCSPLCDTCAVQLREYFCGTRRCFDLPIRLRGTDFQLRVWQTLRTIPYGHTVSYGELAAALRTSPRAIGGAVSKNPVSIIIPCHRVIGANKSLTGYAGGLERKQALLMLERGL